MLKSSKNLQNNGTSISKPLHLPPTNSLTSSNLRLSYPSSLIIPPNSTPKSLKLKQSDSNKHTPKSTPKIPKSHSQDRKQKFHQTSRQPMSQTTPKHSRSRSFKAQTNSSLKNNVIDVCSSSEEESPPVILNPKRTPVSHSKRLDFEASEEKREARKLNRLKKLRSVSGSPSTSFKKSSAEKTFNIQEYIKSKEQNNLIKNLGSFLDSDRCQVDISVKGRDLNVFGEESDNDFQTEDSTVEMASSTKYSVYQDWKLLEAAERYKQLTGESKALQGQLIWSQLRDPETQRPLLEGKRDMRSMWTRYNNFLCYLSREQVKGIQGMVKALTRKELNRLRIQFANNNKGKKEVTCVEKSDDGKIERLDCQIFKDFICYNDEKRYVSNIKENRVSSQGTDEIESFETEEISTRKKGASLRSSERSEDISNFNDSQLSLTARVNRKPGVSENKQPDIDDDIIEIEAEEDHFKEVVITGARGGTAKKKLKRNDGKEVRIRKPLQERTSGSDQIIQSSSSSQEVVKFTEKIKDEIIKKRKKNWEYDSNCLIATKKFEMRRATRKFDYDPNFSLFVDMENEFRQFVRTDDVMTIEGREEDIRNRELKATALEYGKSLEEVTEIFKKVSWNFKDLEKYMKTKNASILWTSQEDEDLKSDNKVALKYLMRTKGPQRIEERKEYFKKTEKKRGINVIISD